MIFYSLAVVKLRVIGPVLAVMLLRQVGQDHKHLTISVMVADWHELLIARDAGSQRGIF